MNQLKSILDKYGNVLIATVLIFSLTALFVPSNFKNKAPVQSDIIQYKGAASEITQYRKAENRTLLWTNSIFGGMPGYTISNPNEPVIIKHLKTPAQPRVWSQLFLYVFCAFVMLLSFKVRPWLALVGAIGIGFATENLTILAVGHNTKAAAIGYLPLVIAGCQYLFRKKYLFGVTILSAGFAIQIFVNHVQITYYGGFMVVLFFLFMLVDFIRKKQLKEYFIVAALAIGGAGIALGANSLNLLLLQEYAQESIRGKSALTISKDQSSGDKNDDGLNMDYVFSYSNGWSDIGATIIPNYSGGDSDKLGLYYGQIGSTSGPKYIGATLFILFILGLVFLEGPLKWWLVSTIIITIILSMGGNNFVWLNKLMFEYFPLYSKFRAPSMMMVLVQISAGLLGVLGLEQFFSNPSFVKNNLKKISYAGGAGVAIILLLSFTGTMFNDFSSTPKYDEVTGQQVYDSDTRYAQTIIQRQGGTPNARNIDQVKTQLVDRRIDEMKKDGTRSLLFVLAILLVLWLSYKNIIKPQYSIALIGLLITADLWNVGKRYLNDKDFKKVKSTSQPFVPYQADLAIQQDKDYYRVLDLTQSTLNSNRCAYFHKSIGGYSAAKIRRFQDLWDWYLTDDLGKGRIQDNGILNMLNMKYFIYPNQQQQGGEPMYGKNVNALGNAWIIPNINIVENADSAILNLGKLNTRSEGLVEKEHSSLISTNSSYDTSATVKLISYHPEKLEYDYNSTSESNVGFSEVFYDKGWVASIDGQPTDHYRLNYILRGLKVPSGKHKIKFEFKPKTYAVGSNLAGVFGTIIYLLIGASIFFWFKSTFLKPKQ